MRYWLVASRTYWPAEVPSPFWKMMIEEGVKTPIELLHLPFSFYDFFDHADNDDDNHDNAILALIN